MSGWLAETDKHRKTETFSASRGMPDHMQFLRPRYPAAGNYYKRKQMRHYSQKEVNY